MVHTLYKYEVLNTESRYTRGNLHKLFRFCRQLLLHL